MDATRNFVRRSVFRPYRGLWSPIPGFTPHQSYTLSVLSYVTLSLYHLGAFLCPKTPLRGDAGLFGCSIQEGFLIPVRNSEFIRSVI